MPLRSLFRRLLPPRLSCREVNRFLADYHDGALDTRTARAFESHLATCPQCLAYFGQYADTLSLLRDCDGAELPPALVAHTRRFLAERLGR